MPILNTVSFCEAELYFYFNLITFYRCFGVGDCRIYYTALDFPAFKVCAPWGDGGGEVVSSSLLRDTVFAQGLPGGIYHECCGSILTRWGEDWARFKRIRGSNISTNRQPHRTAASAHSGRISHFSHFGGQGCSIVPSELRIPLQVFEPSPSVRCDALWDTTRCKGIIQRVVSQVSILKTAETATLTYKKTMRPHWPRPQSSLPQGLCTTHRD